MAFQEQKLREILNLDSGSEWSRNTFAEITNSCAIFGSSMAYACGVKDYINDVDMLLVDESDHSHILKLLRTLRICSILDLLSKYMYDDILNIIYSMCDYDTYTKGKYSFSYAGKKYDVLTINSFIDIDLIVGTGNPESLMDCVDFRAYRMYYHKGKFVARDKSLDDLREGSVHEFNHPFKYSRYLKLMHTFNFPNFIICTKKNEEYGNRLVVDKIDEVARTSVTVLDRFIFSMSEHCTMFVKAEVKVVVYNGYSKHVIFKNKLIGKLLDKCNKAQYHAILSSKANEYQWHLFALTLREVNYIGPTMAPPKCETKIIV